MHAQKVENILIKKFKSNRKSNAHIRSHRFKSQEGREELPVCPQSVSFTLHRGPNDSMAWAVQ